MKVLPYLDAPISQAEFAQVVGISEARVSTLVSDGVLVKGQNAHTWLLGYCERLRDQAAGRAGEGYGLDLVQERAALARSQREAQDLKNAVARGEYAPIGLLSDVLGEAASAVVDRMDQVEGQLRKACPELSEDARQVILRVLADARNEWIRSTASLVSVKLDQLAEDQDDEEGSE